jgi:DnaJ-class molecular chaperone
MTEPTACPRCRGLGTERSGHDRYARGRDEQPPCETCGGTGEIVDDEQFKERLRQRHETERALYERLGG